MPNNQCGLISRCFFKFRNAIDWLFDDAVRPIELMSSITLMSFASIFIIGSVDISLEYPYRAFAIATSAWWWVAMFALGAGQFIALTSKSLRSDRLSAILLAVSMVVYLILVGLFSSDYPPLSTAVPIYFISAVMCMLGSVRRMTYVRIVSSVITK